MLGPATGAVVEQNAELAKEGQAELDAKIIS